MNMRPLRSGVSYTSTTCGSGVYRCIYFLIYFKIYIHNSNIANFVLLLAFTCEQVILRNVEKYTILPLDKQGSFDVRNPSSVAFATLLLCARAKGFQFVIFPTDLNFQLSSFLLPSFRLCKKKPAPEQQYHISAKTLHPNCIQTASTPLRTAC